MILLIARDGGQIEFVVVLVKGRGALGKRGLAARAKHRLAESPFFEIPLALPQQVFFGRDLLQKGGQEGGI